MNKQVFIILSILSFGIFAQKKELAQIKTPHGEILIWLFDDTPEHKASFIKLAKSGYWDNYSFNRVIPNFVAQGGCPDTPGGFKDTTMLLKPEFKTKYKHEYGSFAAGRDDNPGMLSAKCQFYIVVNKAGLTRLDNKYTVYGKVIRGMEIIERIVNLPRDKQDAPIEKVNLDVNIIRLSKKELKKLNLPEKLF